MKNSKLFACALAVVGLVGCGGVEGTYKLDKDETKKAMDAEIAKMPADQQAMAKMMSGMADKMDMTLEIKKDNTVAMKMTMDGKDKDESGTWKKEGDDIVLSNGNDKKDMHCKKDGKKLTCIEKHNSGDSTVVFTKS